MSDETLWPDGFIGAALALGVTTLGLPDEVSYIDRTKIRLALLADALRRWTPDQPKLGSDVIELLDDMGREHAVMRSVAAREHELRKATAAL